MILPPRTVGEAKKRTGAAPGIEPMTDFLRGSKEVKSMIVVPSLFYFGGIKAAYDTWFIELGISG